MKVLWYFESIYLSMSRSLIIWCFLLAGSITLYLLPENPHLALGTTFGGLHLTLGVFRLYRENWKTYQSRQETMKGFRL